MGDISCVPKHFCELGLCRVLSSATNMTLYFIRREVCIGLFYHALAHAQSGLYVLHAIDLGSKGPNTDGCGFSFT